MALSSGQNMVNMGSGNNSGLGLNPASDEFKYLFTKKKVDLMNRDPYGTQLGDPKTELDKAWANFKSVNDELKTKGYNYNEAKDGAFGTVIKFDEKTSPKSDWPLKTINGPNGNIGELGAYKPGTMEFADPRMDVNSPKYDKDLADLYKKSSNTYLGGRLGLASNTLLASEELKTIADGLIANGVDVVKLEKDNPNFQLSSVAMSPSQLEDYNAWANSPAGRTTLERASEIANQQNNNLLSGANNNTGPNSPSAVSSPSTVAENEAALKTAWANFKSVNDELKAKGYSYQEAKDGMYGIAIDGTVPNNDIFNNVEGPKGLVRDAARVDESLNDLYFRARAGVKNLWPASASLAQAQSFQEIQDNPAGILAGTNNQVATFGAVPITGQATLGQAPGLAGNPTTGPVYTPGTTGAGNNTGLNPASDEFKYLQAKQESQHVGFSSPKIEDTTAGLAGAWAQFKADNEKLKAEGYDYQEVKPGFYGKPVVSTDSFLTRVSGPKGDIVGVTGSLSSELKDIRVRAKGPASLYDASQQYSADQKVDELSKALIAKGVDIAKLEQDNPQGAMASTSDRWSDFIATHPGTTPEQLQGMLAINYLTIKSMDDRTPEQRVDDAWSDYKASNEKLKAAGYSYDPILDDSKMEPGVLVSGPKGMIWDKPGFSLQLDEASQDKSNPDFKLSSDHFVAQSNLASTKYSLDMYNDISSRLSADGVNLTQLENENPNFYRNSLSNTTGKDIFNSSSLGSLVNSEDTEIMGANAAKNILGAPDRQRGGGAGGNLMQANAANPGVPATGIYIDQFIDPIQAQTNAMNAGTWKPSDGYYFSSPNGVGFDPTGMMADNRITNPEKYKLATADADGIPDKDGYVRIFGTQVGDNKWLKDNGYDYQDVFAEGMPDVRGPKGAFNLGWTTDPAKKGDAQKMEEEAWAKAGVTFAGQTLEGQEWTNNATKILADPWNHPKNKPGLVDTSWLKPNGMTFEQALAAHAALVNTTTGEPKPGVTPAMLSKALVDLRLAGAFEGGGFGTAGLRIEDGMIISGGQLPNAQNSLPSPEWLKSMGYSPGYYYKKPDPQGLGGEYDTQLGADGQIWTAVPPSVLAAMPTTQPALQSATVPAMSAGVVASSVTQTEPANPDYNPALVHAELNPTGSIQKQMELNAYFHSPNPDIQESLKSELNPTGSLKMQADLNNFFANVAPTTNQAPTTAVPSYSIPAPAPATTVPAPSVEATAPIPSISQYSQSVQDQTAAQIAAGNTSPPESIAAFINGGWLTAPTIATPTPTPTPTPTGTAVAYPYYPSSAVPNLPSDVTAKKGDPTVFNRTTLGGATGTQVSGSPTFTPYYTGVQTTVPTPQTAPVNFATKVDSAGVKGDVAVGSVDAAHIAAGGTFADLAAVKAIYDSGDVKKIADWEKFSGTSKPATAPQGGGMSPYSAGDPSTGSTMPAWAPPTTKFTQ